MDDQSDEFSSGERRVQERGRGSRGVEWWLKRLEDNAGEITKGVREESDLKRQLALYMATEVVNLEAAGMRDRLTGVLSRSTIERRIAAAVGMAETDKKGGTGVAFLDLDRFSEVADPGLGRRTLETEEKGDRVIKEYARFLQRVCLEQYEATGDKKWQRVAVAREGGEEMIAVLVEVSEGEMQQTLETIRAEVGKRFADEAQIATPERPVQTVSIGGVFITPGERMAPLDAISAADGLLIKAKEQGRDRVETGRAKTGEINEPGDFGPRLEWRDINEERAVRLGGLWGEYESIIEVAEDGGGVIRANTRKLLDWAVKMDQLESDLVTDELTGALHRGAGLEEIQAMMNMDLPPEHKVAMVMVDVDVFKDVNNNFGHDRGDLVLKAIARVMKEVDKPEKVVIRYRPGGAFIVAWPHAGNESLVQEVVGLHKLIKDELALIVPEKPCTVTSAAVADKGEVKEVLGKLEGLMGVGKTDAKYGPKNCALIVDSEGKIIKVA